MANQPVCRVPSVLGVSELSTVELDHASADVAIFVLRHRRAVKRPRFNLAALDVHWIKPTQADEVGERIESLGPDAERELRMLRMFYAVGREFMKGAASLRDIAQIFERRECDGIHPKRLASTLTSISRECAYAKKSFGERFDLEGEADLFVSQGERCPVTGLSPLGRRAWCMTRDCLIRHRMISSDT